MSELDDDTFKEMMEGMGADDEDAEAVALRDLATAQHKYFRALRGAGFGIVEAGAVLILGLNMSIAFAPGKVRDEEDE